MIKKYSCLAFMLILSISFISAEIGISGPYAKNFPLTMGSGETIATYFKIQNTIGNTTDINVEVILEEGSDIVTILNGPMYEIPSGEEAILSLEIKIPSNVRRGKEYPVKFLFKPTSIETGEGMIQFNVNINREFKVIVGDDYSEPSEISQIQEEEIDTGKKPNILFFIVLGATILSIILIIILLIVRFVRKEHSQ